MSKKYKFKEKDGAYFISFATIYCWVRARCSHQQGERLEKNNFLKKTKYPHAGASVPLVPINNKK
jgi:hypothetical protein